MATLTTSTQPGGTPGPGLNRSSGRGDVLFRLGTKGASVLVLAVFVAIVVFLVAKASPALGQAGWRFFTETKWLPDAAHPTFGIAALAWGTLLSSLIALVMAVPVALGTALYITEMAPPRLGRWIGYLVDLLAAVPSVVYGLWGVIFLVPHLVGFERGVSEYLGFIPLFSNPNGTFGRSVFAASVILAIMVLPIIAAVSREVVRQVPRTSKEAAIALGATRWEVIRMAVLPPSRSGLVGAVMLGLGRAIGETIAVALVLATTYNISIHIFQPGGNTIAANIATQFGEAGSNGRNALIASGLVLFAISLIVNLIARLVVMRSGRTIETAEWAAAA
jgi:phosphate ABC transporter permease protein PstC